jgi:xylulokinase
MSSGYVIGLDCGSSSIKAALLDTETGRSVARSSSPDRELPISAPQAGWAEQHPEVWWEHVCRAFMKLREQQPKAYGVVKAIGISYQMHGLVVLDSNFQPLRPSIIWCDSRAVEVGERACRAIGRERCMESLLNSPGNFTAAKLAWLRENEPAIYQRTAAACLPGDYIAYRLTRELRTSISGLSEGIMWDFQAEKRADVVLEAMQIDPRLIPEAVQNFGISGEVLDGVASELGLPKGVVVSYRAGDQPNNALSLNVLDPEEVAATAGTSGVVYGVSEVKRSDPKSRVNTFLHVNHSADAPRLGVLLCVNGTGALYRWLRESLGGSTPLGYELLNSVSDQAPIGSKGLVVLPYGNGAERTLENRNVGGSIHGIQVNVHNRAELLRASQEGIVFALNYGLEIMKSMGVIPTKVRAGYSNMFLSPVFASTFAGVTGVPVELYDTDGAEGAARGAGRGAGIFASREEMFRGLEAREVVEPAVADRSAYQDAYAEWRGVLNRQLMAAG